MAGFEYTVTALDVKFIQLQFRQFFFFPNKQRCSIHLNWTSVSPYASKKKRYLRTNFLSKWGDDEV